MVVVALDPFVRHRLKLLYGVVDHLKPQVEPGKQEPQVVVGRVSEYLLLVLLEYSLLGGFAYVDILEPQYERIRLRELDPRLLPYLYSVRGVALSCAHIAEEEV